MPLLVIRLTTSSASQLIAVQQAVQTKQDTFKESYHKKVVCIWSFTTDSEQLQQIIKLTMNIPYYGHRCRNIRDILI